MTAEAAASVNLFITHNSGDAQPHNHNEPTAPQPHATVIVRASSTGTLDPLAVIPSSIATSPLVWHAPPWPPESTSI